MLKKRSKGEIIFAFQLKAYKIVFVEEYKFHPTRRWRFDFAFPEKMFAVEIEGGVWLGSKGGHTSGRGYMKDMEKYSEAAILGWKVLRFTPQQVKTGFAIEKIKKVLAN